MSQVEQELLILPEHPSSPPVFSGVNVTRSFVFCVVFCNSLFVLFLSVIVLFVFLRFTVSDYPFDIFKLFSSVMYSEIKGERTDVKFSQQPFWCLFLVNIYSFVKYLGKNKKLNFKEFFFSFRNWKC
jgi:hypothetical protein